MERTVSHIVVDIESIPDPEKPRPEEIKVPAQYKKPESIAAYQSDPKNINEQWKKQALSYIDGRIHTIAWKINSEPALSLWHDGSDEEGLFKRFEGALVKTFRDHYGSETMYGTTWVGHNIKRFDMPYLWLRARKYKCDALIRMLGASPRDVKMEDTMLWLNFNSYKDYVSLDNACKLFGLPGKSKMDGSEVFAYWQAGKNKEIGEYGKDDVEKTYNVGVALGMIIPE